MSTAPVTKETTGQKIESLFTEFGHDIKAIMNGTINVATQELPAIKPLLPPDLYAKVAQITAAAAQQVAAVDAKYAAIGQQNVAYGVKVAEAIAAGGTTVLALAAEFGLEITNLSQFFTAAGQIALSLNWVGITAPPVPATPAA